MLAVHRSDSITEPSDEQIVTLARKFREEEGQPEGKAEGHWRRAQDQLRNAALKQRANANPGQPPAS